MMGLQLEGSYRQVQYKLADINGDGIKDVVIAGTKRDGHTNMANINTDLYVAFGDGKGNFMKPKLIDTFVNQQLTKDYNKDSHAGAEQLNVVDINNDGAPDITLGLYNQNGYNLHVWLNNLKK